GLRRGARRQGGGRLVPRGGGGPDPVATTDARGIASFRVRGAAAAVSRVLSVAAVDGAVLTGQITVEFITLPPARVAPPPVVAARPPHTARPAPTSTGWVAGTAQRGGG